MDKKILKQISMILEDLRQEIESLTSDNNAVTTDYIKNEIEDLNIMIKAAHRSV